jgi:DNA-3-methyladenine glycosylase I
MIAYHDGEWGRPVHDDTALFEHIVLDGAQAGLSWEIILRKREGYRKAFAGFDVGKVARFGDKHIERLMADPGIVRNRLKVVSAIENAKATLKVQEEFGTLDKFLWGFVDGKPLVNKWTSTKHLPVESKESQAMSKELRARGFKFVGPTICYAFMQAAGLINDHLIDCFRHGKK